MLLPALCLAPGLLGLFGGLLHQGAHLVQGSKDPNLVDRRGSLLPEGVPNLGEFPGTHRRDGLVCERDPEILRKGRVEEPNNADVAGVSPEDELTLPASVWIHCVDPMPEALVVIRQVFDGNAKGLDRPAVGGKEIELDAHPVNQRRGEADTWCFRVAEDPDLPLLQWRESDARVDPLVVNIADQVHQPGFELGEGHRRVLFRVVTVPLLDGGEGCSWQAMDFLKEGPQDSLDVSSVPWGTHRPVLQIDSVHQAGVLKVVRTEVGPVVDMDDSGNPPHGPVCFDSVQDEPVVLLEQRVGHAQSHRCLRWGIEGQVVPGHDPAMDIKGQG